MRFMNYNDSHHDECLQLFDENCPTYFAKNERDDYKGFLEGSPADYFVGVIENCIVSAFGVNNTAGATSVRLSWILVSPEYKGLGVGKKMMDYAKETAFKKGASTIGISASHLSASFFRKFGAQELNTIENGWAPDMHRVEMEIKL